MFSTESSAKIGHFTTEIRSFAAKIGHSFPFDAITPERRESTAKLRKTAGRCGKTVTPDAVAPERRESSLRTEAEGFLTEMIAGCGHIESELLDGDILLGLDAPATVARSNDIEHTLAREQHLVLCPDDGPLVVGRIVAGCDGECVPGVIYGYYLHLLLVLQPQGCPFPAGQRQPVELHPGLAGSNQHQLSVRALACQTECEFMTFIKTFDADLCPVDIHLHAVFDLPRHLCRSTFIRNRDVFCMTHDAHYQEYCQ